MVTIYGKGLSRCLMLSLANIVCWLSCAFAAEVSLVDLSTATKFSNYFLSGNSIKIDGKLESGDLEEFKRVLEPLLSPVGDLAAENRTPITVVLNIPGGDYPDGIEIARLIREHALSTIVGEDDVCISICAFMFMAGRSHHFSVNGPMYFRPNRTLVKGGRIGFHSPYNDLDAGNFHEGVNAIRALREALRDGLPEDLFLIALTFGRDQSFDIEFVADIIRWNIEFLAVSEKSASQRDMRVMLYNACVNRAHLKDARYEYQNPLAFTDIAKLIDEDELSEADEDLEKVDELGGQFDIELPSQEPVDLQKRYWIEDSDLRIIPVDWLSLVAEDSPEMAEAREYVQDPGYMRLVISKDGDMVYSRAAFAVLDETVSVYCSASGPALPPTNKSEEGLLLSEDQVVVEFGNQIDPNTLVRDYRRVSNAYLFPGGMLLRDVD